MEPKKLFLGRDVSFADHSAHFVDAKSVQKEHERIYEVHWNGFELIYNDSVRRRNGFDRRLTAAVAEGILEHTACQIAAKLMVVAKTEEHVWREYEQLMFLVIEMYRKLSEAEKFIAQSILNL